MPSEHNASRLIGLLPVAVGVTLLVAGAPMLMAWAVRVTGLVSSPLLATGLGVVLSLAGSWLGGVWWERRRGSRDVLFGDLLLWGWVRRYTIERRLASAIDLLGLGRDRAAARELTLTTERFSAERQARALEQLAAALEARDPYTHGHSRRVARYAAMIAKRMGLAKPEVARIRAAAAMHDVGKIETPIGVLHKAGRLTDAEFEAIKRHPVDGARMVARVGDEELTAIVRHHHERLDGTGYPTGLSGSVIPVGARIIAVADTFDAITSERPYRPAKAHKAAIEILRREAGAQLDPDAVGAFCSVYFGRRPLGLWIGATNALERVA
ncbi:MAG: HD-GYP domain-containing protein, partial [Actinomycetota bacterium]|nr:HD-GYP domain-containing protein [Actinomycetota bacterium]